MLKQAGSHRVNCWGWVLILPYFQKTRSHKAWGGSGGRSNRIRLVSTKIVTFWRLVGFWLAMLTHLRKQECAQNIPRTSKHLCMLVVTIVYFKWYEPSSSPSSTTASASSFVITITRLTKEIIYPVIIYHTRVVINKIDWATFSNKKNQFGFHKNTLNVAFTS